MQDKIQCNSNVSPPPFTSTAHSSTMPPQYQFTIDKYLTNQSISTQTIDDLKIWLHQSNFPNLNDEQLTIFLLSCNNDLTATQTTIKAYFQCKSNAPELFADRHFEDTELQKALKCIEVSIVPNRTNDGNVVIIGRLRDTSYTSFFIEGCLKLLFMCFEAPLRHDPPKGLVVVLDMRGFGLMHLTRLRLGPLKKAFQYLQEGLPCQLQAIHVLNTVYFIDKLLALIKPFMKKELFNMIKLHPPSMNMEDFFRDHVNGQCMPEDYDGGLPEQKVLSLQTCDMLREMVGFFEEEEEQIALYQMLQ